jgi:hypothetical protein
LKRSFLLLAPGFQPGKLQTIMAAGLEGRAVQKGAESSKELTAEG